MPELFLAWLCEVTSETQEEGSSYRDYVNRMAAINLNTIPDNSSWFAKLMEKLLGGNSKTNTGWSGNNWQGTGGL